jgi:pyrroloquinoline-quinone synthase
MDRIAALDAIVASFDLNTHPFYTDWRAGTLPKEKMVDYSGEYGRFVATIAKGWETLGFASYAEEEREHEVLWETFRAEIHSTDRSNYPQTDVLVTAADRFFSVAPEAVGALYAFEAQQPNTAKSKLDGLNEHYGISDVGKEYFTVHAEDFNEVADLRAHVATMSEADFNRAKVACSVVCGAMWSALDGIYYSTKTISA